MDQNTKELVDRLREQLAVMDYGERVEVFDEVLRDYCQYCGRPEPPFCQCCNDE